MFGFPQNLKGRSPSDLVATNGLLFINELLTFYAGLGRSSRIYSNMSDAWDTRPTLNMLWVVTLNVANNSDDDFKDRKRLSMNF